MADQVPPLIHVRGLAKRGEVSLLVDMTEHEDSEVVRSAVTELGKLRARSATTRLVRLLDDDYVTTRRAAAHALANIADERTADALLRAFEHESDGPTRWHVAAALGQVGNVAAVPALIETLADRKVRDAAARALGRLGDRRALGPLRDVRVARWRWHLRRELRRAIDEVLLEQAVRERRVRQPVVDVGTDLWAEGTTALAATLAPIVFAVVLLDAQLLPVVAVAAAKGLVLAVWLRYIRRRPRRITRWREHAGRPAHPLAVERRVRTWYRRRTGMALFLVIDLVLVWVLSFLIGPELAAGLLAGGFGWLYLWLEAVKLRRLERRKRFRLLREHDSRPDAEHRTFMAPR